MLFSDLHCHPVLKCYGKNHHHASKDVKNEANLFYHKRFNYWNRLLENILKLTPYHQSDLYSAFAGNSILLGTSIYAPERDFFIGKFDNPGIENWVTGFGKDWLKEVQREDTSYFESLKKQFQFVEEMEGVSMTIKGKNYRYIILRSGSELEKFIQNPAERTLILFYNIEGGHNLFHQVETQKETSEKIVPGSIDYIKTKKPLYFTLTHHFYNQLSGHCKSLPPSIENLRPQKYGSDLGLRKQGEEVIRQLLSNTNGQRVLVDIKHMNPRARNSYYKILEEFDSKGDQIPIVFSHGGVNGMDSFSSKKITNDLLHNEEIGLYDDEIVRLVRTGGLFGLNLDERVMSSSDSLKRTRKKIRPKKRFEATSGLLWNNIEQIVMVTAKEKLNPWNSICIGSDYDGIINPINGFWTLKYMPRLRKYLEDDLQQFLSDSPELAYNMSSTEILDAMFSNNTIRFIVKHFGS